MKFVTRMTVVTYGPNQWEQLEQWMEQSKEWRNALTPEEAKAVDYAGHIQLEIDAGVRADLPKNDSLFRRGEALRAQAPKFDIDENEAMRLLNLTPATLQAQARESAKRLLERKQEEQLHRKRA